MMFRQTIHNFDMDMTQGAILIFDLLFFSNAVLISSTAWQCSGPGQSSSHLAPHRPLARVIYERIALVNLGARAIRVNPRIYAVPRLDGVHYQKLGITAGSADNCNGSTPVCFN